MMHLSMEESAHDIYKPARIRTDRSACGPATVLRARSGCDSSPLVSAQPPPG